MKASRVNIAVRCFLNQRQLSQHLISHCDYCNQLFTSKRNLSQHLLTHNMGNHTSKLCNKRFLLICNPKICACAHTRWFGVKLFLIALWGTAYLGGEGVFLLPKSFRNLDNSLRKGMWLCDLQDIFFFSIFICPNFSSFYGVVVLLAYSRVKWWCNTVGKSSAMLGPTLKIGSN